MRMNLPYAEDPKNASIIDVDHLAIVPDGAIQNPKINSCQSSLDGDKPDKPHRGGTKPV